MIKANQLFELFIFLSLFFAATAWASPINPTLMTAVIVQHDLAFTAATVKAASLNFNHQNVFQGVHVTLKPEAAKNFMQLIDDSLGKTIMFIYKQRVIVASRIATSLTGDLIITGMTLGEANQFIKELNLQDGQPLVRDYVAAGVLG